MHPPLRFTLAVLIGAAACGGDGSITVASVSPITPVTPPTPTTVSWTAPLSIASGSAVTLAFNSASVGARDDQQTLHVVWQEGSVARHARLFTGATSWLVQSLPAPGGGQAVYKPTIAFVDASLMVAAWMDQTPQGRRVLVSRSANRGQSWDAPLVVAQGPFDSPVSLVALRRANGTAGAVVAWSDTIQGKALRTTWRGSVWSVSDWSTPAPLAAGSGTSHDVALGARGDQVVAAWEDGRNGPLEIFTVRSIDGGLTWGTDARLTLAGNASARGGDPSVAIGANNTVWVAWQNLSQVYAARSSNAGQSYGDIKPLGPGLFARVAVGDGDAVAVAWEHFANASLFDDSAKSVGLSLSMDGLTTIAGPHAMPGSETELRRVQGAVIMSGKRLDVFWIDLSAGTRTLTWRGATVP